jgi:hypothetical protein
MDRLKMNTSDGYPLRGLKADHFVIDPETHHATPKRELLLEIMSYEANYKKGLLNHPIFMAHYKVEPLKLSKWVNGRTRVFYASPITYCVVMRKFFLTFVKLYQTYRFHFECAVGMNVRSEEWTRLFYFLRGSQDFTSEPQQPWKVTEGDVYGFDSIIPPVVLMAAIRYMLAIFDLSGNYNSDEFEIATGILMELVQPIVMANGDCYFVFRGNMSGHPMTVIINSIITRILMRYAFYYILLAIEKKTADIAKGMLENFKGYVHLTTFGDDSCHGAAPNAEFFNHINIALALQVIGISYTMSDKDAEPTRWIEPDKLSYLCRTWVWDDELNKYRAPLALKSRLKADVFAESKSITKEEQSIEGILGALDNSFDWGREEYDRIRCKILSFDITPRLQLLTYDEMIVRSSETAPVLEEQL